MVCHRRHYGSRKDDTRRYGHHDDRLNELFPMVFATSQSMEAFIPSRDDSVS